MSEPKPSPTIAIVESRGCVSGTRSTLLDHSRSFERPSCALSGHRPAEPRDVVAGGEEPSARAATDEQHRRRRGLDDLRTELAEAFVAPAVGEADHEHAR